MKKIIAIILITISLAPGSRAQSPTFTVDAGYRFPISGGLLGVTNNGANQTGVYGTYGKGFSFGGHFDFYTSKKVAIVVGGQYWLGTNVKYDDTYGSGNNASSYDYAGKQNIFVPSVGLLYNFTPDTITFVPFIGAGISLGLGGRAKESETVNSDYDNKNFQTVTDYTTTENVAFGTYCELGAGYKLSSKIYLMGKLRVNTMSVMPHKTVTTSVTENGTDATQYLDAENKETDYFKNIPSTYQDSADQPAERIGAQLPLSNIEINIGVKFKF